MYVGNLAEPHEQFFCFAWCLLGLFLHLQSVGGVSGDWQDGPTHGSGPSVGVAIIAEMAESLSLFLDSLSYLVASQLQGR